MWNEWCGSDGALWKLAPRHQCTQLWRPVGLCVALRCAVASSCELQSCGPYLRSWNVISVTSMFCTLSRVWCVPSAADSANEMSGPCRPPMAMRFQLAKRRSTTSLTARSLQARYCSPTSVAETDQRKTNDYSSVCNAEQHVCRRVPSHPRALPARFYRQCPPQVQLTRVPLTPATQTFPWSKKQTKKRRSK